MCTILTGDNQQPGAATSTNKTQRVRSELIHVLHVCFPLGVSESVCTQQRGLMGVISFTLKQQRQAESLHEVMF